MNLKRHIFGCVASAAFVAAAVSGAANAQAVPAGAAAPASSLPTLAADPGYVLGSGDVIDVSLVGRTDFAARSRLDENGAVLLPFIGSVKAAGQTALELADQIRKALVKGGYFADPVVRVDVATVSSRYVTVLGAVGAPGLVPLDRRYRLSEVIARVGGKTPTGADFVVLTRASDGSQQKFEVAKLASGGPSEDPYVEVRDKIYVPPREEQVLYVSGQIRSPGSVDIQPGMTMRMALAKAGGVTDMGSEKKLKVVRNGKKLSGVKLDDPVMVGDVITVGERLF